MSQGSQVALTLLKGVTGLCQITALLIHRSYWACSSAQALLTHARSYTAWIGILSVCEPHVYRPLCVCKQSHEGDARKVAAEHGGFILWNASKKKRMLIKARIKT